MNKELITTRLISLRKEIGYTQYDLSVILNVSRSPISKYEKGFLIPSIDTIIQLADLYNVSCDYILCRTDTLINP